MGAGGDRLIVLSASMAPSLILPASSHLQSYGMYIGSYAVVCWYYARKVVLAAATFHRSALIVIAYSFVVRGTWLAALVDYCRSSILV